MTKDDLKQFTGTEHWYRYSPLFKTLLLTDGAKYLAEEAGAYWLMDMIGSYLPKIKDGFAIAKFVKCKDAYGGPKGHREFTLADDDPAGTTYAKQTVEYTDFPLDEIKLYVIAEGDNWVVLLPSEY